MLAYKNYVFKFNNYNAFSRIIFDVKYFFKVTMLAYLLTLVLN